MSSATTRTPPPGRSDAGDPAERAPTRQRRPPATLVALTAGLAVLLVVGFGVLTGAPGRVPDPPAAPAGGAAGTAPGNGPDTVAAAIARTQQRLRDVPGDWTGWASLGAAYVQQARLTADPTYYPKADQALTARSPSARRTMPPR